MSESLQGMAEYVHLVNVDNGWFDKDRPFSADIALLHSEVSEAYEAYRSPKTEKKKRESTIKIQWVQN